MTLSGLAVLLSLLIPVGTHDWPYLAEGARLLSRDGTNLYALRPDIQVGPLSLLLAAPIWSLAGTHAATVACAVIAAAYGPVLGLALWTTDVEPPARRLLLVGLVGVLPWTALAGSGHLDELLTLVLLLLAASAGTNGRSALSGALVGLATAAKPWAITALPGVFANSRRRSALAVFSALAVTVLMWAPFVVGIFQSLRSGYPVAYPVRPGTVWEPWRSTSGVLGSWIRVPQLLASMAACAAAARRGPAIALTVAFAVRIALDPGQWPYQFAVLAVLGVTLDVAVAAPMGRSVLRFVIRSAPRSLLVLAAMLLAWPSWIACGLALVLLVVVVLRRVPANTLDTSTAGSIGEADRPPGA
jgi:hypothetical protein